MKQEVRRLKCSAVRTFSSSHSRDDVFIIIFSSLNAKEKRHDMPIMLQIISITILSRKCPLSFGLSDHKLGHCGSRVSESSSGCCRVKETFDVSLPLWHIRPFNSPIVGQKPVYLSLDICRLGPDAATAGEELDLLRQFGEKQVGAVIIGLEILVDLVRLIDCVNRCLNVPQATLQVTTG